MNDQVKMRQKGVLLQQRWRNHQQSLVQFPWRYMSIMNGGTQTSSVKAGTSGNVHLRNVGACQDVLTGVGAMRMYRLQRDAQDLQIRVQRALDHRFLKGALTCTSYFGVQGNKI